MAVVAAVKAAPRMDSSLVVVAVAEVARMADRMVRALRALTAADFKTSAWCKTARLFRLTAKSLLAPSAERMSIPAQMKRSSLAAA